MKKSLEIPAHLILWILFTIMVMVNSNLYLEARPDAPFAEHLGYVIFLEVLLGAIFFYTTYFTLPRVEGRSAGPMVLAALLIIMLVVFAIPAFKVGIWQVLSSIIPHISMIALAILFRRLFSLKLT